MIRVPSFRSAAALLCLAACGCSAMRELPPDQYARLPERRNVKVVTQSGQSMDFDRIRVSADTLIGLRQKDVESAFDEYEQVSVPLSDVRRLSVRQIDWYRTGLIAGVAAAVALAAVLSQSGGNNGGNQVPGPCGGRPCP